MRPRTTLSPLLLVLLLACATRGAAAEPPLHTVPEARPVQLDGRVLPAEWSDAAAMALDADTTLRLQQYRGTLLLAFESKRVWIDGSVLTLFFCPHGPKAGGRGPGCVRIDIEPFRHDRAHVITTRHDPRTRVAKRIAGAVVMRHAITAASTQLELAFPATLLGLTPEQRFRVRFCAQWARRGAGAPSYPQGLDFRGKTGQAPVDFVSAIRWAVLDGFGDPSGAGAFPKE